MRYINLLGATTADPMAPDEGSEGDALLAASGTPGGPIVQQPLDKRV